MSRPSRRSSSQADESVCLIFVTQTSVALDHRIALVLYAALMLVAAGAIVAGWLRLLPPEREPFVAPGEHPAKTEHDAFAIFLLVNVTVSVLLRFPGLESANLSAALAKVLPSEWANHGAMIAFIWFGFVPGLAAVYSLVRRNPLRWPLVTGGTTALVLWLAAPLLLDSIRGAK